ncbi:MAG TPA: TonB-dependent receptor, partial [Gammaproteobacteria bacterium]|nr:TonB-dependent receptor [Gammaproteobacteria bacterium]
AYSGEFLEKIGGSELNRVAELTPGFVIQLQDRFAPGFSIRGITTNDINPESELRVAIFQDGVAVTHATASYGELFDIDRIEVEKGPQSTLHGRSALNGGAEFTVNF